MKIFLIRVFVWSQLLFLYKEFRIDIEDLPYVEYEGIKMHIWKTPIGAFVFLDMTDHLDSLPTPDEFANMCTRVDLSNYEIYETLYDQYVQHCLNNSSLTLEEFILH